MIAFVMVRGAKRPLKSGVPRDQNTPQNLDAMRPSPYTSAVPWMDMFLTPWRRPLFAWTGAGMEEDF